MDNHGGTDKGRAKMSDTWLKEKIVITLTRKDMFELANAIADANHNDVELTMVRDRTIRKMFRIAIEKRHNLWLKVTRNAQNKKGAVK